MSCKVYTFKMRYCIVQYGTVGRPAEVLVKSGICVPISGSRPSDSI